jgi:hypothetical protein
VPTLERAADHLLTVVIGAACAVWLPSSGVAQVANAPAAIVPARPTVALRADEPIQVRHGFELQTGRFAGWNGDSLMLMFDIGAPLALPLGEVGEIFARRRTADRAIAGGLFFGALALVTLRVTSVLAGGITQCEECVESVDVWGTSGRIALATSAIFLIADYFRPPYRVVYRRPADCC